MTSKLKTLARGEPGLLTEWLREPATVKSMAPLVLAVIAGCSAYGFALGFWRAPLQGVYVAIKMPLLVFLTLSVNGVLNGMLGQLLGSGMTFRQTVTACLMSFAIFSLIVGSLSPILIWLVSVSPKPDQPGAADWYRLFLLFNTVIISFAGIVANYKLLRLIQNFSGGAEIGWRTLISWLAGNLFVGAQLSYNLRPFFGSPDQPIQFLRDQPFHGNFYEALWAILSAVTDTSSSYVALLCILMLFLMVTLIIKHFNPASFSAHHSSHPPSDIPS